MVGLLYHPVVMMRALAVVAVIPRCTPPRRSCSLARFCAERLAGTLNSLGLAAAAVAVSLLAIA